MEKNIMVKLKDIRDYMINSMSHYDPSTDEDYDDEYYDEDGHCGDGLWLEIQEFWDGFKTDSDFKYLVSCEWASDELDLEGGRSYLLDSKLVDMCFDYMYNTLGWSKEYYQNIIHNTLSFSEDLEDKYGNISVQRDIKINSIIDPLHKPSVEDRMNSLEKLYPTKKKSDNIWSGINFDNQLDQGKFDYIPNVIRYHKSMKEVLESCNSVEYLGKSKVDDDFYIYKIKSLGVRVPKGYEVVKTVDEIMSN